MIRRAITVVELVVVVGVMGILLTLTMVGVQSARESARAVECQDNNHQLGIAVGGYMSRTELLPPVSADDAHLSSWFEMQQELGIPHFMPREHLLQIEPPFAHENQIPALLQCPSDHAEGTNYRLNCGSSLTYQPSLADHTVPTANGPSIRRNPASTEPLRANAVLDGMSQTSIFSERLAGNGVYDAKRSIAIAGYIAEIDTRGNRERVVEFVERNWDRFPMYHYGARNWIMAGWLSNCYNHIVRPNRTLAAVLNRGVDPLGQFAIITATSNHRGGVYVTFLDGSVRLISDSIDLKLWRAMSTRAGRD